jgi:hypothetical protein
VVSGFAPVGWSGIGVFQELRMASVSAL